jgi:hypothetical protein
MADEDLASLLIRFHREVVVPDIDRAIGNLSDRMDRRFDQVLGHFDHIYKRLDKIDSELVSLNGAVRSEQRIAELEAQL